jgi:hypothetical protein
MKIADPSPWSPLAKPTFRALWLVAVASHVGTWMHDVGAGWKMTELSLSPLMVALVQAPRSNSAIHTAEQSNNIAEAKTHSKL